MRWKRSTNFEFENYSIFILVLLRLIFTGIIKVEKENDFSDDKY